MLHSATISPDETVRSWLTHLAVADPEASRRLQDRLNGVDPELIADRLPSVVDAIITALTIEIAYGYALADGAGRLLVNASRSTLSRYLKKVEAAADRGATLATLLARHLAPVLACNDPHLADRLDRVIDIMLAKGTYTLKAPLETLCQLIDSGDMDSVHAFVDLMGAAYALDTSYNRTVYLTHTLSRAVNGFAQNRRSWQIRGLTRIMQTDERLADDYLQGLAGGLNLLTEAALHQFLDQAIRHCQKDVAKGAQFLSLDARRAQEICRELQITVPLTAVRSRLERYLLARTGLAVTVRSGSAATATQYRTVDDAPLRCDGRSIYLPEEMEDLGSRAANAERYQLLVRLEAGTIEFGSYDFDADKVLPMVKSDTETSARSDLSRFVEHFDHPRLALDLFVLFEHARIGRLVDRHYPGLASRLASACAEDTRVGGTLYPLYRHLVLGVGTADGKPLDPAFQAMAKQFEQRFATAPLAPETSARTVMASYAGALTLTGQPFPDGYATLSPPFGRRFDPALFAPYHMACHLAATDIVKALAKQGVRLFRSDVRELMVRQNGQMDAGDLEALFKKASDRDDSPTHDLPVIDLQQVLCAHGLGPSVLDDDGADAYRYREWDTGLGDYLPDRVLVREHMVHGTDSDFYAHTLTAYHGLARRIRYAFELLRPEALTILRQWRDGDAFDYRALLDYAIDRKAGLMPSDRLFIKRVKRIRDVAVLLLVDLSRSTANTVDGRDLRVLDVEKQAMVLLCEALSVVGDRFAIAGFSGTGPLGVDYYRVKDLDAPFDDAVKARIGAMAPQRSTRMGAAIRHATALLTPVQARVRLIMVLGDGFPNDIEYKGVYAVEDTRRAVTEARAASVHVKAITVNASDNGQLDRLYGKSHHTLINNVRDLPDRLVRVYSMLTRH